MKRLFAILSVALLLLSSCGEIEPENGKNSGKDSTDVTQSSSIVIGVSKCGMGDALRGYFKRCINDAGGVMKVCDDYCWYEYQAKEFISKVDALVCPGSTANDADGTGLWPYKRAKSEDFLIAAALAAGKPVLGICYGHQRLNSVMGGSLASVATLAPNSTVQHKIVIDGSNVGVASEAHSIDIDPDSKLARLLGETHVMVNTSHVYALDDISPRVKVVARADDGIVEAIEGISENVMGVQFHPEYLYGKLGIEKFRYIFDDLVLTAKAVKGGK